MVRYLSNRPRTTFTVFLYVSLVLIYIYRYIDKAHYPTKSWLERVVILGLPPGVKKAHTESKSKYLYFTHLIKLSASINVKEKEQYPPERSLEC